jgi:hypothetical protein
LEVNELPLHRFVHAQAPLGDGQTKPRGFFQIQGDLSIESIINFTFNKEIKNVPNYLSDAVGLTDCGNINSRYTQALELHCGDLLNYHRYSRVGSSLT